VSLGDAPAGWLCHSDLAEIIYNLGICKAQRRKTRMSNSDHFIRTEEYEFSLPFGSYVESFYAFSGPK